MREYRPPLRWKRRPLPQSGSALSRGTETVALVWKSRVVEGWSWSVDEDVTHGCPSEDRAKMAAIAAVRRRGL